VAASNALDRSPDGGRGHLRGIDAYTVRAGKIARKATYFAL
jgi:hypothetical protein